MHHAAHRKTEVSRPPTTGKKSAFAMLITSKTQSQEIYYVCRRVRMSARGRVLRFYCWFWAGCFKDDGDYSKPFDWKNARQSAQENGKDCRVSNNRR